MKKKIKLPKRDLNNFEVKIGGFGLPAYADEVEISVTPNGYQWSTISIPKSLIDELIIKLLQTKAEM